ncbi:Gfo/Idh/MocA family oxidoreductase [Acidobacteria bacterium AH-259-L09]|nr:Gfo/Idh/MocA family oxidoreductase [Acidobacteria bacterium AH-259-L09]
MNSKNRKVPRRTFLKRAGLASAVGATFGAPHLIPSGVLGAPGKRGPNDRIQIGHIGMGGRARGLWRELGPLRESGEAVSVAVCDIDERALARAAKDQVAPGAKVYHDYRYILERKDIDAVVIGTPDHWHGVQFVHAAESGKHIYCEKPACCTIEEGKAMVAAARKAGIAAQIGSQGRSQPEAYLMHRYLANGVIGKVSHVECFHYPSPVDTSGTPDSDPPPELDWDMWLGPLRWRPYNERYCPGKFRWMMESGGGQIRDRGAHVMSCAMWWLKADGTGPVTVEATGTPPKQGAWDAAVLMNVTYTFKNPDRMITWTQMPRQELPPAEERRAEELNAQISRIKRPGYGAIYHGEDGTCMHWGGDGGTWAERKVRRWEPPAGSVDVYKSPGHFQDWFNGIRTGQKTIMNIEAGVGVAFLCILGNLSYVLGRKLQWDHSKQEIVADEHARRLMSRPQRHPYHL